MRKNQEKRVEELIHLSEQILEKDHEVKEVVDLDFERVIYLEAGPFFGLAHEAQLKILELTAGKIATMYERSCRLPSWTEIPHQ